MGVRQCMKCPGGSVVAVKTLVGWVMGGGVTVDVFIFKVLVPVV